MKILVTGFDPFGGEKVNPAWEAVSRLPREIGGAEIAVLQVPTVFGRAPETVLREVERLRPDAVVAVGQAAGRTAITPERIAINLEDARIADNAGFQPSEQPVVPGGPDGYFSLLPVKAMADAIKGAGLPGSVSNTAGTFVCNHLMYHLLHACHTRFPGMIAGFVHVPCVPEQSEAHPEWFSMELDEIVRGLTAAIGAVAMNKM
jgi:pyroglutamyl-peptidase